jgi:N-acetyl-anhydromuramyl-L-alanine amidase AmpD
VLHDTEGGGTAPNIIDYWAGNGNRVAAHFIVQRDGQIWQCVDMEHIAHHAGYGNIGHNKKFDVTDESRDDKKATASPTRYLPDYGMNSYSIGIEMIHQGNQSYTTAQLKSLDKLIAYIDVYYGKELTIIDHKMWRIGNSDTSPAFATYLENYRDHRSYK